MAKAEQILPQISRDAVDGVCAGLLPKHIAVATNTSVVDA